MLRQLFTRPTKRAIQAGGTVLLAGAMVCGSVPAYAIGSVKPHQATPIAQPNEPAVTCTDRALFRYLANTALAKELVFDWAECAGLITEYQKHELFIKSPVISRGQFLEYLYRLSGSPEVKNLPDQSPYGDIKTDDPRFPVVMWARERGITWGWSDGNFHYDTPAGDATIVLMLYRLAGKPDVNVPEYHREAWGDPWDKEWPNMPYGSELHKAYLWITQKTSLEKEGYIKEHYNVRFGMNFSAQAGKNSWFTFAEYDLAFSALRVADSLGAFEK